MMSDRSKRLALMLPILLLVFMVGRAEWQLAHSDTWFFSIQGYDPRDLLRGHYMRFQLDVAPDETLEECDIADSDCCYCLVDRGRFEAHVTLATCETARLTCEDYVQTQPLHSLDRFYIPETGRRELETRLREAAIAGKAHLAVAVDRAGQSMIEGLWVDGEPIELVEPEQADLSDSRIQPDDDG